MLQAIGNAATGLLAATAELSATASNIANADAPGYQSQDAYLVDLSSSSGIALAGVGVDTSPATLGPDAQSQRQVDLTNEMATLTRASILYGASARALQASNSMLGNLLDIRDTDSENAADGDDSQNTPPPQ